MNLKSLALAMEEFNTAFGWTFSAEFVAGHVAAQEAVIARCVAAGRLDVADKIKTALGLNGGPA